MKDDNSILPPPKCTPWNKGKLIGAKPHDPLSCLPRLPVTLLIGADELCIGQYVAVHRSLDLRFRRAC